RHTRSKRDWSSDVCSSDLADLFNSHQHDLIEAARAHAELLQWEAFTEALEGITDSGTRTVMTWLRDLYGLTMIEKNLAWYLLNEIGRAACRGRVYVCGGAT